MNYEDLKTLDELRRTGAISEEEYQREKAKFFEQAGRKSSSKPLFGMSENAYVALMHVSQFFGYLLPFFGFITPFLLWMMNKDNRRVAENGRNIVNFILSWLLYSFVASMLIITIIGIFIALPLLILLGILHVVFVVIATLKAANGETWVYPLSIPFLT